MSSFGTSLSCMDGRIQIPIQKWLNANHGIDFVDTITEPGIDKIISDGGNLDNLKKKIQISTEKHKSQIIVVSGHYDCAGNPVSNDEHKSQIQKSVEMISSWNLNVNVIGLWVDDSWSVCPL